MSVSDLTNTTWIFNSGVYVTSAFNTIYINFNSYHNNYTSISFNNNMGTLKYNNTIVYDEENIGGWMLEDFQEITITGGTDATNSTLISWLESNATMQESSSGESDSSNHTHFGSTNIIKKTFGNLEITKEVLNGTIIYEKSGSSTPSSYQVTITASGNWNHPADGIIMIYDGQNNTGTELLNQNPANKSAFPMTLEVTSGYCYISVTGSFVTWYQGITSSDYTLTGQYELEKVATIDKDGTIDIEVKDFDD